MRNKVFKKYNATLLIYLTSEFPLTVLSGDFILFRLMISHLLHFKMTMTYSKGIYFH